MKGKRSQERLGWTLQSKAQEVRSLKSELKNMKKSLLQELRVQQDDSQQKISYIQDSIQRFSRQYREKEQVIEELQQRYDKVAQ